MVRQDVRISVDVQVSVNIVSAVPLASIGSAAILSTVLGTFLVARTGQDTFSVVTATCAHEGCTITGFSSNQFACPCHGSRFTIAGAVVNGPATRALRAFPTQIVNDVLSFNA